MKTASAQKGRSIYLQNCAVCHGPTGQGNGPLASGLAKKPADLAESKMSDQQLFKVTQDGGPAVGLSSEMKPFGDRLSDAQIADVVAYVKTLRR